MELLGKNGSLRLSGKYGKWEIIRLSENKKYANILWWCKCECGTIREVKASDLNRGKSLSCGCHRREVNSIIQTTHGMSRTKHPLYSIWKGMRNRCLNPKSQAYKFYGGRGITICERWKNDFTNFYNDMKSGYIEGLTLDRTDVNLNYDPWNCKWSTRAEQAKNRSDCVYIETLSGKITATDASRIAGISLSAMMYRIDNKWPIEKLLISSTAKNRILNVPR